MGGEIVVLSVAHAHLVLQHLGHRCYALTVAVACHLVHVLCQQVVVALLAEVALVVCLVVDGIGVLRPHVLESVLVRYFCIVDVHLRLAYL